MDRILNRFLASLGQQSQPAVWVSGFYGSGKSHFVRVLQHLWCDTQLLNGASARSLLRLPSDVQEQVAELTVAGRREGGLWAAAGTLSSGASTSANLAFLQIVFRAAGLPEHYAQARLMLYLRREGHEELFLEELARRGKELSELTYMAVSPQVHEALMAVPGFGDSAGAVKDALKSTYPRVDDCSTSDLVATLRDVLRDRSTAPGKVPLTLIVLDELQQFIGEDSSKMLAVQEIVQAIQTEFDRRVLVVATGQSQLLASPLLSRLKDRFPVLVHLEDVDVEAVLREVVLLKDPRRRAELDKSLDEVAGEIGRELDGTAVGPARGDSAVLAADYPVLPARRRLWEMLLKALNAGGAAELRNQLRLTHEAVQLVADRNLGTVVATDFLYAAQRDALINSGSLLREVDIRIQRLREDGVEGLLKARICAVVYLVTQLPDDPALDLGVHSTSSVIADLLVEDLGSDGQRLRAVVPGLLDELVSAGMLQEADGRYQLQTKAGQEWQAAFSSRLARVRADDGLLATRRTELLRDAVSKSVDGLRILHGTSRTPRRCASEYSDAEPTTVPSTVQFWVRDGWSVDGKAVREDAAAKGASHPLVHVFVPRHDAEALKSALASYLAADQVLDTQAPPTTDEGRDAERSMRSRRDQYDRELGALIKSLCDNAQVFRGGGTVVDGASLHERLTEAAKAATDRMFPEFKIADSPSWPTALKAAQDGRADALASVGYPGDPRAHSAAKKVLQFVGAGKRGQDVLRNFEAAPFGWPRDAISTVLLLMLHADALSAARDGLPVKASEVTAGKLGTLDLRGQSVVATADQKVAFRKLAQQVGIAATTSDATQHAPAVLSKLLDIASAAGGDTPLPPKPNVLDLQELAGLPPTELVVQLAERAEDLTGKAKQWVGQATLAGDRVKTWALFRRLLSVATAASPDADDDFRSRVQAIVDQYQAVLDNRALLDTTDPLAHPVRQLTEILRDALQDNVNRYRQACAAAVEELKATSVWADAIRTAPDKAHAAAATLTDVVQVSASTPEELLGALEERSFAAWQDRIAAVSSKAQKAHSDLARALEPDVRTVVLPRRTLHTVEEVEEYLYELRTILMAGVASSPVLPN